jgi:hypothetical protein
MNTMILPVGYYPLYKDISDLIERNTIQKADGVVINRSSDSPEMRPGDPISAGSPVMLNAEGVVALYINCEFSLLQTVILLLKNTFEGHVYLNYNIRPEQFPDQDLFKLHDDPESVLTGFYEQLDLYREGLESAWNKLKEHDPSISEVCFESLMYNILSDQLIRFPVALCSSCDILQFKGLSLKSRQSFRNRLLLTTLGGGALSEFIRIENVNTLYTEKFKDLLEQLQLKEDVLNHYNRKLVLAFDPDITNEDELDACLYKHLVESKIYDYSNKQKLVLVSDPDSPDTVDEMFWNRERVKHFYRLISKNCAEVHTNPDSETSFPELHQVFLDANRIYNEPVSDCSDALLQQMRLALLFSQVINFRKSRGLAPVTGLQVELTKERKDIYLSEKDVQMIRRKMESRISAYKTGSYTDYKMKYVVNDEMKDIHRIYLKKHVDFIDQQIEKLQIEIKNVLKLKFQHPVIKK